jgi:hypothetical protein
MKIQPGIWKTNCNVGYKRQNWLDCDTVTNNFKFSDNTIKVYFSFTLAIHSKSVEWMFIKVIQGPRLTKSPSYPGMVTPRSYTCHI